MKNSNKKPQDFYDENDEANELEKQMSNSWMSLFCGVVIVVLAIAAAFGFDKLIDYLTILYFGYE